MKRTHVYEQSEILFVLVHRKLNFWAIFAFLQISLILADKKGKIDRVK